MKEQFAQFEIAKKLKELGFDEPCFTFYWNDGVIYKNVESPSNHNKHDDISAPLWQQVFEFFRVKYKIWINIEPVSDDGKCSVSIICKNLPSNSLTVIYDSFDKAREE